MTSRIRPNLRLQWLVRVMQVAAAVLFAKTFLMILWEYRNYFPANFQSNFLAGRELFFNGTYRIAFYAHIVSGPICLAICTYLMWSGNRKPSRSWHQRLGKLLVYLTILVMLPSGLIMATRALSGPVAGWSFVGLTLAASTSIVVAAVYARSKRFKEHRVWATRSFILLSSPLLLRLMTGATILFQFESEWTYRFAVWASWIIPLAGFELSRVLKIRTRNFAVANLPSRELATVSDPCYEPKFGSKTPRSEIAIRVLEPALVDDGSSRPLVSE